MELHRLAIVLMAWAFGWSGGQQLVRSAYSGAKEKEAERRAEHRAKKEARTAEKTKPSA